MEVMKFFGGTCAPDAGPECEAMFDAMLQGIAQHEQFRMNASLLVIAIALFIVATFLTFALVAKSRADKNQSK